MAIEREMILKPADLDRISIECKSCEARIELSLRALTALPSDSPNKPQGLPAKCPSCQDDWKGIRIGIDEFRRTLLALDQYKVTFRVMGD